MFLSTLVTLVPNLAAIKGYTSLFKEPILPAFFIKIFTASIK